MKDDSRIRDLRTLPLHTSGAADAQMLYRNQRLVLQRRGEFVRSYLARDREGGDGQRLDPVLASHLGLEKQ